MEIKVSVKAEEKDKFIADFYSSATKIYVDLNKDNAAGPNPLELFLSSLASCVCVYARKYLIQHSIGFTSLVVEASANLSAEPPTRLVGIRIKAHTDAKLDGPDREVFLRFMKSCPLHNTVIHTENIEIDLI